MRFQRSDKFANRCTTLAREPFGFDEHIQEAELDYLRLMAFGTDNPSSATSFDPVCYLASEVFSKWTENKLPTAVGDAYDRFTQRELVNAEVNARLRNVQYTALIGDACRLVERVLKGITVDSVIRSAAFSGGASAMVTRNTSTRSDKWNPTNSRGYPQFGTCGIWSYYDALHRGCAVGLHSGQFTIVPGDTITTVNKNWKVDRIINPQPALNLFFQKGLGREIRRGLRRFGLLHPNAQQQQRRRAQQASFDGRHATLDLRDASMSVTKGMVDALIEGPVWKMIYDFRSPGTWLNCRTSEGKFNKEGPWGLAPYEMISTMGNGFTFELETLLFWAIAAAACKQLGLHWSTVTVYGDDVIIPTEAVSLVTEAFDTFGLELNKTKSFYHPHPGFRESCGGHYWRGYDVTPFYLKRAPDNIADVILLHNKVQRWVTNYSVYPWGRTQISFEELTRFCRRETPKRFFGPAPIAGCLWASWDKCVPRYDRDTQSYAISVVVKGSNTKTAESQTGAYLSALWDMQTARDPSYWSLDGLRAAGEHGGLGFLVKSGIHQFIDGLTSSTSDEDELWESDPHRSDKYRAVKLYVDRTAWDMPDLVSAMP